MEKSVDNRTYYKGNLVFLGNNNWLYNVKPLGEYDYIQKKMNLENADDYTKEELVSLRCYLNGFLKSGNVTRKDIVKKFDKMFSLEDAYQKLNFEQIEMPILFTIDSGFAREVHTGISFPIISLEKVKFNYEIIVNDFYDSKMTEYLLQANICVDFKNLGDVKITISNMKKATKEEINHYFGMFGWFKANQKKKIYQEKIKELAKKNDIYKRMEVDKNKRLDESIALMEQIEYKLESINKRNPNLYKELKNDYENIKQSSSPKEQLLNFSNMLEVIITFNLSYKTDILSYIEKVKAIYLLNIHNLEFNKFNFYHIEAMTDLLYQQQSSYSIMEIRTAELALSTIYLLEMYKNKDLINDMWILENSYVNDLLQTIVLCMITLKNEGIITLDEDINLDEELNVSKVFSYIKNMKIENSREK